MRVTIVYDPRLVLATSGFPMATEIEKPDCHVFIFEDPNYDDDSKGSILEDLFRRFNYYESGDPVGQQYCSSPMPSLSVGMLVQLDKKLYLCMPQGWKEV